MTPNVAAFLATVSHSEGTDSAPDPYRVCYGFPRSWAHTIKDLTYHPSEHRPDGTIEWKGESLESLGEQYKHKISTAAGKYQIILPTWEECKHALNLRDFTGPSQDDAAIRLIKKHGALDLINGGQVSKAITLCNGIWASMPGSTSGQPQSKYADLIDFYLNSGGSFA